MIRNVVMGRLRHEADRMQLETALAGIAALKLPGLLSNHTGFDAGLRGGGWTFAITNDWQDAESYRVYDLDPEHNVYRRSIVEVCDDVARVQFEL
ncbi:hypothetical protein GCM10007304_32520 [Rhodococcoides trifolii]|uniref:Stress-response A/B barrel domain-containing protein n=1 Tax=Rhodococcoides trifolii TaxID=908250 RepID=A0A917LED9_9NOCA|nr:Dabb family protein [Rhodococcus trifolii]GGG15930.1 hypothetical protein GCM10007304_32520 [Rhodococcus trifolii]